MNSLFDAIADGLADSGYAIVDQFLTPEEVFLIRNIPDFRSGVENFKQAGVGSRAEVQVLESVRNDYIKWVDRSAAPAPIIPYLEKLDALIPFLNRSLYLSLKDYELHLTMYPEGSFYRRHRDQFRHDDHRKLSVICYLNEGWQPENGGALRMYLSDRSIDVLPEAGRLVCFRSDQIEHEVLVSNRLRLSITGWILDKSLSVPG